MQRPVLGAIAFATATLAALSPLAKADSWQHGIEDGVRIAGVTAGDGTFLGFFCAPLAEPKISFMILKPGALANPIAFDEKPMDVRFIMAGERFDLPGQAGGGEIYAEIKDYNLALQFDRVIEALRGATRARVAIPVQRWSIEIPIDGAAVALDGLMAPCR